jgi:geranylgeranyl diphosphate synthase, type II
MVHTYSLIHDDLPAMDDDDLRRGRPTNHKQFGEALAILAGDALLTRAFEIVAVGIRPPDVAASCCADLAAAAGAAGMVGGQVADLEAEDTPPTGNQEQDGERLIGIHRRKTGALIACAVSLGARIAGVNESLRVSLSNYGQNIGLAFQITDDLLDIAGDRDRMGKGVGKDADRGKLTYPGVYGIDESRARAKRLIESACAAVEPLGSAGEPLADLARFVLERDH